MVYLLRNDYFMMNSVRSGQDRKFIASNSDYSGHFGHFKVYKVVSKYLFEELEVPYGTSGHNRKFMKPDLSSLGRYGHFEGHKVVPG